MKSKENHLFDIDNVICKTANSNYKNANQLKIQSKERIV